MMLLTIGILIIVVFLAFICVAVWRKKIATASIFALAAVGLVAGIVVTNLPDFAGLVVKYGGKDTYSVQLQRVEKAAKQVQTDADEVRRIKEQVEILAKRVEQGEQSVVAMRDNVQHAYQSLFQALGYVVLTRNLFPPPGGIMKELERHINLLAEFAYPNPQERAATIQKMMDSAKAAQPQPPSDPQSK